VLLYRFIPKIAILSTWGCFLALFGPSRGEKGQKKVNRQTLDKKNYRQKKRTNAGYFVEKKSWLYDNYPQSYIRLLLGVFFVPTRYMLEIKKLHVTPKILVLHVRNKEKKIVEKQSD